MTLKFLCPSGHRLKSPPQDFGRQVTCPACGHEVIVPSVEDLGTSELQKEDSETFVDVSVDGPDAAVSTPPALPRQDSSGVLDAQEIADGAEPRSRVLPRPVHVYQADEERFNSIKWLTFFLGLTVVFSVAPIAGHFNLLTTTGWPRGVLVVAVLQACYLGWMLSAPDWSTVRVVMIVFFLTAMIYGATMTWIALAPAGEPLRFGLEEVRHRVLQWCGCVLTLMLFGAYLCARASSDWRRAASRETAAQARLPRPEEER